MMIKKIICICLTLCIAAGFLAGCNEEPEEMVQSTDAPDVSAMNNTTSLYAGVDDLGRTLDGIKGGDSSKEVGIFYFPWIGTMGIEKVHDTSKILEKDPNAPESYLSWMKAGGGGVQDIHWWGESLFGYYTTSDVWVIERDVQMLTDAGIDFLMMDASNGIAYEEKWPIILEILDKYYRQGFEVPKVTAVTYANSGLVVETLYEEVYKKYPEYSHLWYRKDGKPLMIGMPNDNEMPDECLEFFSFLYPQWPREPFHPDGIAWMDFGWWTTDGTQAIFGTEGSRTIMTVSLAQHSGTLAFSSSAFYGDTTNHTRSWHDGANDPAEDAYLYGYNFAEQFEYAIECNPDTIFITGWNEWIAARQGTWREIDVEAEPIILVDNCNINNSRDIQPMKGGYGDNYYMQMMQYIRKFKGAEVVNVGLNTAAVTQPLTIDVEKSTSQWNAVKNYYLDYAYEIEDRKSVGYGGTPYVDKTGRNDIYKMKITHDAENLYAYVQTANEITGMEEGRCLSMFISTGNAGNETWCGYDFVVNRTAAADGKLAIEKRTATGWEKVADAAYQLGDNELQFAIPLSVLGLDSSDVSIQFKFADNYQGDDDIFSFYLNGDAAPYGRLNYVYESKGIDAFETFVVNTKKAVPNGTEGEIYTN